MTVAYKSPATSSNLNNSFISKSDDQNASGEINFVNGIEINGTPVSNADGNIKIESVKSLIVPSGNTSDAGASATWVNAMVRYDGELSKFRAYENGAWKDLIPTGSSVNGLMAGSPQIITSSGTYDKTINNPRYILVEVQAAGGGGGGVASASAIESGGGGGGQYGSKVIQNADLAASTTITIGAVGAGGASGNTVGGTAGTSSFGAHITCIGGTGGGAGGAAACNGGAGGTGGTGGTFYVAGGYGGGGRVSGFSIGTSFGGGSHLGSVTAPENATPPLRRVGSTYGGGGSGNRTGSAASEGAAGGPAVIIIWEFE